MTEADAKTIDEWFTYHVPTPEQKEDLEVVREAARAFAYLLVSRVPSSADRTAALRKLRECVMTANAAIVLHGKVP